MRLALLAVLFLLPQQDPTELRVAWGTPKSIDPAHAGGSAAAVRVATALFSGLTTFDADGVTVVAGAADRWSASDDRLTWTFTLRDAKWSDGAAVTAADFREAWLRSLRPETGCPLVYAFAPLRGALAYWEDRRVDQDVLTFDALSAEERRATAKRFGERATKRHVAALRAALADEKDGDARAALEAALKAAGARADVDEKSVGVEAVDARTLRVSLASASPTILEDLAGPAFLPVPAKVVAAKRDQWTHPQNIVTNGPYTLEKWTSDELTLKRASGGGPERVTLLLGEHLGTIYDAYERGRADWIEAQFVPQDKMSELVKRGDVRPFATFTAWFLRINASRAPCDRIGVRRALARAVDRGVLLKHASRGAEAAVGLVPPGAPGYIGAAAPVQDTVAAMRHLMAEAPDITKFPKLDLLGPKTPLAQSVVFALKEQLEKDLGVKVRTDLREWPAYEKALAAGEYHVAYGMLAGPALDPAVLLEAFVGTSAEFDGLVSAASTERDAIRRMGLLARAEQALLAEGGGVIPLHTGGEVFVARAGVKVASNPMGRVLLAHVRLAR